MSVNRLLRAERLAKRSAAPQTPTDDFIAAVMAAQALRPPHVWAPRPPPEAPIEPPVPALPPPAEATAAPQPAVPAQPLQWWEERCRWRARTAADDYADAEDTNEDDDPLGLYS